MPFVVVWPRGAVLLTLRRPPALRLQFIILLDAAQGLLIVRLDALDSLDALDLLNHSVIHTTLTKHTIYTTCKNHTCKKHKFPRVAAMILQL